MARMRRIAIAFGAPTEEKPLGNMRFADPSTAIMGRDIHTFNEPHSPNSKGESRGYDMPFGSQSPWGQNYDDKRVLNDMRRKRGVLSEEEE